VRAANREQSGLHCRAAIFPKENRGPKSRAKKCKSFVFYPIRRWREFSRRRINMEKTELPAYSFTRRFFKSFFRSSDARSSEIDSRMRALCRNVIIGLLQKFSLGNSSCKQLPLRSRSLFPPSLLLTTAKSATLRAGSQEKVDPRRENGIWRITLAGVTRNSISPRASFSEDTRKSHSR